MAECNCAEAFFLRDLEADEYTGHLVRERVEEGGSLIRYRCPDTGREWIMEFRETEPGRLSMQLRRVMTAGELIERLAASEDGGQALLWTHPEIEFRVPGSEKIHHGLEAAEQWAAKAAADPAFPKARAISVIEVTDEEALVLGDIAYQRDKQYVEYRPSAWLVALKDGKLARSLWFDSWDAGRKAAGLPTEGGPHGRRLAQWLFSTEKRWTDRPAPAG